jgi:outer membrane protein assembly factor BamB
MAPDPLYVATVAENVRSSLRTTDDPNEVRRYLYELRDTLYEAEFDGEPYTEMLDALESHLDRLEQEALGSIGETRRERIIDEVHRVERFCQRQQDNGDSQPSDDGDVTKMGNNITINIGNAGSDDGCLTDTTGGSGDLDPVDAWDDDDQWNADKLSANTSGEDAFSDSSDRDDPAGSGVNITPKTWHETAAWDLKLPFGTTASVLRNGSDWPTYRRDLRRQGADSDVGTFGAPTLDWKTYLGGSPLGEPAVLGERLVVPTKEEGLLFLSRSNGDQRAQFDPGTTCYTSPVVHDGTVYCGFDDGLYAMDRWGDQTWKHSTNNWVRTVPLAFDGVILFGDSDGTFYALDADTGRLQGSFNYDDTGFEVSPAIHDGTVVAGTAFTALGINYETGTVDWTTDITADQNSSYSKAPAIIDGTVYYPGKDAVYALNPNTGVVQWQADISDYGRIVSAVAATDASLYVCTHDMDMGGYLHTIRKSGTVERTDKLEGGTPTSPVATDWGVIVGSLEGPLERYEGGESLFPEWMLGPSDDWTRAAPVVNDGTLYASFSRSLYAFS